MSKGWQFYMTIFGSYWTTGHLRHRLTGEGQNWAFTASRGPHVVTLMKAQAIHSQRKQGCLLPFCYLSSSVSCHLQSASQFLYARADGKTGKRQGHRESHMQPVCHTVTQCRGLTSALPGFAYVGEAPPQGSRGGWGEYK